jgi:hypothetical protein
MILKIATQARGKMFHARWLESGIDKGEFEMEKKTCPMLSNAGNIVKCQEEGCAWWNVLTFGDKEYGECSVCALPRLYDLSTD